MLRTGLEVREGRNDGEANSIHLFPPSLHRSGDWRKACKPALTGAKDTQTAAVHPKFRPAKRSRRVRKARWRPINLQKLKLSSQMSHHAVANQPRGWKLGRIFCSTKVACFGHCYGRRPNGGNASCDGMQSPRIQAPVHPPGLTYPPKVLASTGAIGELGCQMLS